MRDSLANKAKGILEREGYKNIYIKIGDGTLGWPEKAPFDKIIITASSPDVPKPLLEQLLSGGRMVIPVGQRFSQELLLIEKSQQGKVSRKIICGCTFVPLVGEYGWKDKGNIM